jgi:hypothetical protein
MSQYLLSATDLRELITSAIPAEVATEHGIPPDLAQFFVPKSHARALNLNVPIVVGERGTGKSYWWNSLQSRQHRAVLEKVATDSRIRANTIVMPGFGEAATIQGEPSLDAFPTVQVVNDLLDQYPARVIWKAVIVWAVAQGAETLPSLTTWPEKLAWFTSNTELADRLLQNKEVELLKEERDLLIVFDALDRITSDPRRLDQLIEGLAQNALELRTFRKLRAKVFLRSDQFDPQRIGRFADASKLRASSVTLHWLITELYGMLWHLLANHPGGSGAAFRQDLFTRLYAAKLKGEGLSKTEQQMLFSLAQPEEWTLPSTVFFDPAAQERLFHHITGSFMGENARKGFPYRWLPTHLADAHGKISPRSFQIAVLTAAQYTQEARPDCEYAIYYKSLYAGVRKASEQRSYEMKEEYPWIYTIMDPLRGLTLVPFDFGEVEAIWLDKATLDQDCVRRARLSSPESAKDALIQLGVIRPMRTGKYDVPDIYRLEFRLGRKGGIPLTQQGRSQ